MAGSALEVTLADALVADLNDTARNWDLPFTAERGWLTELGLADLTEGRRVIVCPPADDLEIDGEDRSSGKRCHGTFDYPLRLVYQAKVDAALVPKIDVEADQVQDIHDRYWFAAPEKVNFASVTGVNTKPAYVTDVRRTKVYDLDKLRANGLYEAELVITVRIWRT